MLKVTIALPTTGFRASTDRPLEGVEWSGRDAYLARAGNPLSGHWEVDVEQQSLLVCYPSALYSPSGRIDVTFGVRARAFLPGNPPIELGASAQGDTTSLIDSRLLSESVVSRVQPAGRWLGEARVEGAADGQSEVLMTYLYVIEPQADYYWRPLRALVGDTLSRFASALARRGDTPSLDNPYNNVASVPQVEGGRYVRREYRWWGSRRTTT